MNKSLRYAVVAATSAAFLALAPGLALAVGPGSGATGQQAPTTGWSGSTSAQSSASGHANANQPNGLAGTYQHAEKGHAANQGAMATGRSAMNTTNPASGNDNQAATQPRQGLAGTYTHAEKSQNGGQGTMNQATGSTAMNSTDKTPGVTSGPATGNPVVPNTAVTKSNGSSEENMAQAGSNGASPSNGASSSNGMSTAHTAGHAAMGAGAPGTPAHQGTEAGTAPQPQSAKQ